MAEVLYQVDATGYTMRSAVQEFARTYWAEPRKARKLQADGTFQMVGGVATYQVVCVAAERLVHPAYYHIVRKE